jgi:transposase
VGVRDRLVRNQTKLSNAIRSYAAEFGLAAAKGMEHLGSLLSDLQTEAGVPALAKELFAAQAKEFDELQAKIAEVDAKLTAWQKTDPCCRRLMKIPGVGPIGSALLTMKTPAPEMFKSGRDFAAWIGLTPKDHSTAGKLRLGVITRAGDESLRAVLVVGATAVVRQVRNGTSTCAYAPWISELLKRKAPKLVALALANKMARIAWKLMLTGQAYNNSFAPANLAKAA